MKTAKNEFFDPTIEPDSICGNCEYHAPSSDKGQICCNRRSANYSKETAEDYGCGQFFPHPNRWPDADHG